MRRVGHPTAGLHLIGIKSPVLEFGLEQRAADIRGIVQFARTVVVQYLGEHTRMSIEVELIEDRIVVGESFGQTGKSCGWNLLQRCFV